MKSDQHQDHNTSFPESELTPKEKQMLQAYQDREYLKRWEKVAEASDNKAKRLSLLKWGLALALSAALLFLWFGKKEPQPVSILKSSEIAGLVDYPFMEQQVRGGEAASGTTEAWKTCITLYKKGDYSQALEKSEALDRPFFTGLCQLHLKHYEAALAQFDLALKMPKTQAEIYYYKGFCLQQLGRKEEAKAQFRLALESKELREEWRMAAEKGSEE